MENNMHDNEVEIDLREVFFALKKKLALILAVGVLCGSVGFGYSKLCITPTYTSTSSILAISKKDTMMQVSDMQLGKELVNDYKVLITSTPVLEKVVKNLKLEVEPKSLRNNVSVNNSADTRILEISVTDTDPVMAQKIVNNLTAVASEYIGSEMEVTPPKIIEKGQLPLTQTAPNIKKNAMLGFLAGAAVIAGIVVFSVVRDDTIKTEDDITKYLGIPTLASVPDRKDYINKNKKKTSNKKIGKGRKV